MKKQNWILLGILMLVPMLAQKLLSRWGIHISPEASMWMFLTIAGFFVISLVVPKEHRKYAKWFVVLFLLLFITSVCKGEKKQAQPEDIQKDTPSQTVIITTEPSAPDPTAWQQDVEIPGKNPEGDAFRVPEPGNYEVVYLGGDIYDTPTDRGAYDIWGAGYDSAWKEYFPCSNVPGVKALEALLITDGEVGKDNGNVCQFPDRQKTVRIWVDQYVRFFRHEAFRPDINGNKYWCFQNNSGSWKFRISEAR